MRSVRNAFLVGLLGIAAAAGSAQTGPARPAPGPWPVGFSLLQSVDSSRQIKSGAWRPLDIGVWYPAKASGTGRLTYRDYFLVAAGEEELRGFTAFLASHGAGAPDIAGWMEGSMLAQRDPPPAGERFPLVLLAQGNGQTIADQAPLAEYLASHGYVVATTPSPMRVNGPMADEGEIGMRAAEQATDLEKAADLLRTRRDISGSSVGVVAHSFGARAGLLMLMRGENVRALVSLDGGIGTATGRDAMERVPGFRADAVRAPILHFYERQDEYMTPDFSLLRSLTRSERWTMLVPLRHHLFTSLGAATLEHPGLRSALAATDSTPAAYTAVLSETLAFLDAFLKGDRAARSRLAGPASRPPLGPLEKL